MTRATLATKAVAAMLATSLLVGCVDRKDWEKETTRAAVAGKQQQIFTEAVGPAINRITVPVGSFMAKPARDPIPDQVRNMPVSLSFPQGDGEFRDLVTDLHVRGISVAYKDGSTGIEDTVLPLRRFEGSLGEFLDLLRSTSGIEAWWHKSTLMFGQTGRYSVILPQNEDLMSVVQSEIEALGATNTVLSLHGGQLFYDAPAEIQDERIQPYLNRVADNMSMIALQVAVVSISADNDQRDGFDWNAFNVTFDTRDNSTLGGSEQSITENVISSVATASSLSLFRSAAVKAFGMNGFIGVTSAINFLNQFGNTRTDQNVELRTLAGQSVRIRSGQEVPYIRNIISNASESTTSSGTEADTVSTGLTLDFLPYFDGASETVTVELNLTMSSILRFAELSAGNQIGTLTQPVTQDQELEDIVRLKAGETVIIGGLQYDSINDNELAPFGIREVGSLSRKVTRNTLFVILRPVVTVYVPDTSLVQAASAQAATANVLAVRPASRGDAAGALPPPPLMPEAWSGQEEPAPMPPPSSVVSRPAVPVEPYAPSILEPEAIIVKGMSGDSIIAEVGGRSMVLANGGNARIDGKTWTVALDATGSKSLKLTADDGSERKVSLPDEILSP